MTINNLLPGIHATDRAEALDGAWSRPGHLDGGGAAKRGATIPAGRYGTRRNSARPARSCARQHAGFIVGQNLLLDGGAANATL